MPLWNTMSTQQQQRAIRAINFKIRALMNAKAKLRDRRDTFAAISHNELLLIKLELIRLQAKIDALRDEKAADFRLLAAQRI